MAFTSMTKPSVGDPTRLDLIETIIDNLNDLNGRVGSSDASIPNGSFENDEDADGLPDSWTRTNLGGTLTLENDTDDESAHASQAVKYTYPASASGGGYLETDDFLRCKPGEIIKLAWMMKLDSADGAKNIVRIYWYDYNQDALTGGDASTDAFSDTGAPTTWQQCYTEAEAPADAKFFKIRLIASDTSATPSGTGAVWFDEVKLVRGPQDVFNRVMTVGQTRDDQYDSTYSPEWKSPAFVGLCWAECIGGGGGGGTLANAGAGGGGAYAAGYFIYAASTSYACDAGEAGLNTTDGGDSTFNSTTVVADGGEGSDGTNDAGEGGLVANCTGQIKIAGSDGDSQTYGGRAARGGAGARKGTGGSGGTGASWPGGGGAGDQYTSNDAKAAHGMVKVWWTE